MRQGFEPLNGNFSNMVMARDFGHKGLRISYLAADILSSHVLWRSLDSTPARRYVAGRARPRDDGPENRPGKGHTP